MKLSGIVWLILGVVVAIISFILVHNGQKMQLFMYAGIALAVFGAIKLFVDKEVEPEDIRRAALAAQLPGQRHIGDIPRVCSVCNTKNNPRANFCGNCGTRL